MEWKTTDHVELAEYWASPSDRRDVRSVETWYSVNNWYCLYSRMTGVRSCDQVPFPPPHTSLSPLHSGVGKDSNHHHHLLTPFCPPPPQVYSSSTSQGGACAAHNLVAMKGKRCAPC